MYTLPASYRESHDNEPKYFNNMSPYFFIDFPFIFESVSTKLTNRGFTKGVVQNNKIQFP